MSIVAVPDRRWTTRESGDRFWSKVDMEGDCWIWTAARRNGYGAFWWKGRLDYAHRVAYQLEIGTIPDGMYLDHRCHVQACVRPAHLRIVTNKQNQEHRDGAQVNSRSGVLGVSWNRTAGKWHVQVHHGGTCHRGGYFTDLNEAERAAVALRNSLYTHNDLDRKEAP